MEWPHSEEVIDDFKVNPSAIFRLLSSQICIVMVVDLTKVKFYLELGCLEHLFNGLVAKLTCHFICSLDVCLFPFKVIYDITADLICVLIVHYLSVFGLLLNIKDHTVK